MTYTSGTIRVSIKGTSSIAFVQAALVASIFLEKFQIPGLGVSATAFLPVISAAALAFGLLKVDTGVLSAYLIFVFTALLSCILSQSPNLSITSVMLVLFLLFPLCLRLKDGVISDRDAVLAFASDLILIVAILSISQFYLQTILPLKVLFPFDFMLPKWLLLPGYNNLAPLTYGSSTLKSNGVFCPEPSYLSQILSLGVIIESYSRRRLSRFILLLAGMYCSFSGTGILILIFWFVFHVRRDSYFLLYISMATACIIPIYYYGSYIGVEVLLSRIDEIFSEKSSGFARFASMFFILKSVIFQNSMGELFGRGPGTVTEFFDQFQFVSFDPTWGKLIYEYGIVGALAFISFYKAAFTRESYLVWPVTVLYFVTGGYLGDPFITGLLATLVVWLPGHKMSTKPEQSG